ncbi:GTPase [Promicromonospora iranensis]|uniref:GTP-binding protein EngB required for normal cell division n=1 Tax=Promicromonospora iranensis TaxID=1105144 RepID=A0ABU2CL34_9MICO|nr:GTPase [Promicromonospora iranensis]MDR7381887.1 GTP-binding protein EngB required for normal cell division [Promicromonospora iranensis]
MSRLDLADRTTALETAVEAAEGRIEPALLDEARAVATRARERGGLSAEHTVVALAGATGSGKSSVLNAVAGVAIAQPGVRRPTTSHPMAAVWGEGADPLLDWLEVGRRHQVGAPTAEGEPSPPPVEPGPSRRRTPVGDTTGLVLLDLPDHDSVVTEHRMRAERLVQRADLLVWVVDPQKYADAALHEGFLRPLAGRAEVVVVALNQADRLTPDETSAMLADLKRLVAQDGLEGARVLAVSARTGQGMDDLQGLLAKAAAKREAATARLAADERAVAQKIVDECGTPPPSRLGNQAKGELVAALEAAAGVPTVVDAVRASARRDARAATGWPLTRWVGRLRKDPLRRLGLRTTDREHRAPSGRDDLVRTSLPTARPAVRSAAASAVRRYVEEVTRGAADPWVLAARARGQAGIEALPDALDQAVATTRVEASRRPVWWSLVNVVQWTLITVVAAGLLWLLVLFGFAYLQLPPLPTPVLTLPTWSGDSGVVFPGGPESGADDGPGVDPFRIPWPTLMVLGGLALGLLLALVCRVFGALGARRRAMGARRRLRQSVGTVADKLVRAPVGEELSQLASCRTAATVAAS